MARIHTLSDFTREDKHLQGATPSQEARNGQSFLPFTTGGSPPSRPSVLECLLPKFSFRHSVFIIAVIDLVFYVVTVAYDRSSESPVTPSMSSLAFFGASVPVLIRRGQIWRLFCPLLLHSSISHLLINAFMQIRIGASIEEKYGTKGTFVAYLVCGILGNLMSAAAFFCNALKVGASTAIFGLVGIDLGELVVVWESIEDRRPVIVQLLIFALIFVFLSLGSSSDVIGHVGGMAVGVAFGLAYNTANPHGSEHVALYKRMCYGILAFVVVLSAVALWLLPRNCM